VPNRPQPGIDEWSQPTLGEELEGQLADAVCLPCRSKRRHLWEEEMAHIWALEDELKRRRSEAAEEWRQSVKGRYCSEE
jgi:hypothetical protein